MYAIIEISGVQYKVLPDKELYVRHLGRVYKEGEEIILNTLLIEDESYLNTEKISTNRIQVKGKILAHIKTNKVTIFKKKRRKGYKIKKGHRQKFSIIKIISINNHGP